MANWGMGEVGRYEVGRVLGRGKFGTVCFARHKDSKAPAAIKIIDKDTIPNHNRMIKREISTMKLIKHPHVVQLLEVLASKKKVYIVLEYVGGGELFDKILDVGKLSEEKARNYFQQLIGAVDYCHSRGVYHRDLKPENLLLDARGNLKISDFGLSALSQQCSDDGLLHTACGTPNYLAPEVLHGKGYDGASADLWSCGIILYVLLAGFLPFDEPNIIALYRKVTQANFSFPSWFSSGARSLIKKILNPNPKKRITIPEILNHNWFKISYIHVRGFEKDADIDDIDWVFEKEEDTEKSRPPLVNAFEIISMSPGLNLSGLFKEKKGVIRSETLFATKEPAKELISNIEDFAKSCGFNVKEKNYRVRLQNTHPGRKGFLSIVSEVFEVGPSLFMVRMKKTSGDTLEYNDFHKKLTVTLKDVVWKNDEETTGA